jgi:alpha-mannosidase
MKTFDTPLLVTLMAIAIHYAGAQLPQDELSTTMPLKGYLRSIAGETLDYNCFNPLATTALLTRCTSGDMAIEWETEAVPQNASGDAVIFKWIVSYSTITSAGDRKFDFFINDRKEFVISTRKGVNPQQWTLMAADGSELRFQFVKEDAARDANGYMYLKVPLTRTKKGEPLRLRVVGEKANSSDWFMTFTYDLRTANIEVLPLPFLTTVNNQLHQSVCVSITYMGEEGKAAISLDDGAMENQPLARGENVFQLTVPAVRLPRVLLVDVVVDDSIQEALTIRLKPVMKRTIYLLPHAHTDIGYTDLQPDVLKKHVKNIHDALHLIRKTASYPPEAQFRWNIEVLWAVESFLENATAAEKKDFFDAIRSGHMVLHGLFANVLTGIMRPEEFYRLSEYARSFKNQFGIDVTSAMISDIPGMTWNTVPTLAQAGIRYLSNGPNGPYLGGDRTGHTNATWADRPFYWVSPSGSERILFWQAGYGYGSFFGGFTSQGLQRFGMLRNLYRYFTWLDDIGYPYDMIQMRHTINGDNGTVDPDLPDYVKGWNAKYVSPKVAIATTDQLFSEFEREYGKTLPAYAGDFTPYWEDGAASTARELGINRTTAEYLIQTEALHAILATTRYDGKKFSDAWKDVLLFDEHTWGAHNSITDPDSSFVVRQWEIKQRFALDGARAASILRDEVLGASAAGGSSHTVEIVNTNSWQRTDLVLLPKSRTTLGDVMKDEHGKEVPSQRLSTGELAFLAMDVPALGARRYTLCPGVSSFVSPLRIEVTTLHDDNLVLAINESTGSISRLETLSPLIQYADTTQGIGLNEYLYVDGLDAREALRPSKVLIAIKERGPLVASFEIRSQAPGCAAFMQEVRVVNGLGRVDLINTIDKMKIRTKEAVHFDFPFCVPEGVVRIDLGFGVVRPDADQLPGSCKDYFSAQRWVDVSNQNYGVTLTVAEAPLVEVGNLHSELPSPRNVNWRKAQGSSPHLASYVMNNYWHTNYKADQEGGSVYHYSLVPHGMFNQANATRSGVERSQPLIIRYADKGAAIRKPLFRVSPANVVVSYLKPINGGKGYLVRLFNAGGSPEVATLHFAGLPKALYLSDPFESKGERVRDVKLPANGIVTLRIE